MTFKPIVFGDAGSRVHELYELLSKTGSSIKETSEFTIGMLSAVRAFQRKQGLPPSGIVDKDTWKALKKASK